VFVLHGTESNASHFADLTDMNLSADKHGFYVVYPYDDDGHAVPPCHCWDWEIGREQSRDGVRAKVLATLVAYNATHNDSLMYGDPARVYVTGLSAGGAMASLLAATYPDVFIKAAPAAGYAFRARICKPDLTYCDNGSDPTGLGRDANLTGYEAFQAMQGHGPPSVPIIDWQGGADGIVPAGESHNITTSFANANDYLDGPTTNPNDDSVDFKWDACVHYIFADTTKNYQRMWYLDHSGNVLMERWLIDNMGHMWSGSDPGPTSLEAFAYRSGPNQSEETWRFFDQGFQGALPNHDVEPACEQALQ
jgi:poly(hydroxyalkanoate) depolymerase family esterase